MAVGDIWEIKFITRSNDQLGVNVCHYAVSAQTGADVSAQAVADYFSINFGGLLAGCMWNGAEYRGVIAARVFPGIRQFPASSTQNSGVGSRGPEPAPSQLALVLSKHTALAGRAYRGRLYIPFPALVDLDTNGTPKPGLVTAAANLGLALLPPQTIQGPGGQSVTMFMCIWHQGPGGITQVIELRARKKFGTQRRRGVYGNVNPVPI